MNIADIITEFGAYFLSHGQGQKDLTKILNWKADTDELFTRINTTDTIIRRGSSLMDRVLQPFQNKFTPTGAVNFTPHEIKLFKMKVDVSEFPDELEQSWLGFLASDSVDRKTWPFVKWWLTQIMEREEEDYEVNEVFSGEFTAPGDGVAGAAGTAMDGIRFQINAAIDASTITPIVTGALEAGAVAFVTQVEEFIKQIDYRYRRQAMTLAMSLDNETLYRQGMREKYNVNYAQANNLVTVMDHNNITVKGYRSWGDSDKLLATPKANALLGVKREKNPMVESDVRLVKLAYDYYKGVGFLIHELVFTNDQDLNPAE